MAPADGRLGEEQYEIYHDSLAPAVLSWQARYEGGGGSQGARQVTAADSDDRGGAGDSLSGGGGGGGFALLCNTGPAEARQHARGDRPGRGQSARAQKAENEAWALKTKADEQSLLHEKEDAEKAKQYSLAAELQDQTKGAARKQSL